MNRTIRAGKTLRGRVAVPGDKSIAHRAVLLGAIADGASRIENFAAAGDPLATVGALEQLGIEIEVTPGTRRGAQPALTLTVHGRGLHGLQPAGQAVDCRNAGTAMRLLAGLLAGQRFDSVLDGSEQLRRRPMRRVIEPLAQMGGCIAGTDGRAPLTISGRPLRGIDYRLPVASAQVKSAVILAALYAEGGSRVLEPGPSRDYTERMLRAMGAAVVSDGPWVTIQPPTGNGTGGQLAPLSLALPGDISSAAFLAVAALLLPGAEVWLENVGVNPTRTGLLDVLESMGALIGIENEHSAGGEPVADLVLRGGARLGATTVGGDTVVRMIDEFPILAVAATQAEGTTVVRDAQELRVKEVDRIARVAEELRKLGARVEERPDGLAVEGPVRLAGAVVDSHGDHRLAMALAVAGLLADGETTVLDAETAADSFPGFWESLAALGADVR